MPAKGIKKQVLGGVLFCLGAMTALLARTIGFELDIFYVAISIIGAGLFLCGAMQEKQYKLTRGLQRVDRPCTEPDATTWVQQHRADFTACTNLASQPAPMRQRVSIHGD
jgi:hypothetical protein